DSRADEYHVRAISAGEVLALLRHGGVHIECDAGGGMNLLAIGGTEAPGISLIAQHAIGDPERFNGGRERQQGKVWDEEENQRALLHWGNVHHVHAAIPRLPAGRADTSIATLA